MVARSGRALRICFANTAGSLVGLLIYLIPGVESPYLLVPLILVTFFAGVLASGKIAGTENPDPHIVVIDEIVGMWIAVLMLPKTTWVIVAAFLLFRLFDIVKPFPARQSEKLPGGWGIMVDDVVAGIYANIVVQGVLLFI